jgi:hypothetical protein
VFPRSTKHGTSTRIFVGFDEQVQCLWWHSLGSSRVSQREQQSWRIRYGINISCFFPAIRHSCTTRLNGNTLLYRIPVFDLQTAVNLDGQPGMMPGEYYPPVAVEVRSPSQTGRPTGTNQRNVSIQSPFPGGRPAGQPSSSVNSNDVGAWNRQLEAFGAAKTHDQIVSSLNELITTAHGLTGSGVNP